MKKLVSIQFFVLLAGTLFAWRNFVYEVVNYLNERVCTVGCADGLTHPMFTPCFCGALVFAFAFVLSVVMLKNKKRQIIL